MVDNRFYKLNKKITIDDLVSLDNNINVSVINDRNIVFTKLSSIDTAKTGYLTFFDASVNNFEKRKKQLLNTNASYVILNKDYKNLNSNIIPIITNKNPYKIFTQLIQISYIKNINTDLNTNIDTSAKISKNAIIENGVKIGKNVIIEDFVKISNGVEIMENTIIKCGTIIGENCLIGRNCLIKENCVIDFTEIGENCCINSNSTIGHDGFGYKYNNETRNIEKIPHFGYVKIENNVEIGSNTCIDRGVFIATTIEDNVKIDNLVQIGHNVYIGKNTLICSQSGIAGSVKIGENCILGARTGILDNNIIGDNSVIHAMSLITKDFPSNSNIIGSPAENYNTWTKKNAKINIFFRKTK